MSKTRNETNREWRGRERDEEVRNLLHMARKIGFSEIEVEELNRLYSQQLEDAK